MANLGWEGNRLPKVVADLHMHSKYSRATSPGMELETLSKWAKIKGIGLLGTGDFSHPEWFSELERKSIESDSGFLQYDGVNFVLTNEVSCIYSQGGRVRRIHIVLISPSLEIVAQINERLAKRGNLKADGRPIFGMSAIEMAEIVLGVSEKNLVIPAHCLLPESYVHAETMIKKIKDLQKGETVLTHMGRYRSVEKVLTRGYAGDVLRVVPWHLTEGTTVTPEHPFFAIKTEKNCSWTKRLVCKPTASHKRNCYFKAYERYKPEWIAAESLEKGDVLVYPKIRETHELETIDVDGATIDVDNDFCRLAGYYAAEGYTNNRDAFCFSFNRDEQPFIRDVCSIVHRKFGLKPKMGKTPGDIIFYSKTHYQVFQSLFYINKPYAAENKCLPAWMLKLPLMKQKEALIGWWRGDRGYTVSRVLANQMKEICLRLDIIPNMFVDTAAAHKKRGKHLINGRKISANFDIICLIRLSFLDDKYRLLDTEDFKAFQPKKDIRHGWFDDNYVYIPIRKIEKRKYSGKVYNLEVDEDNSYVAEAAAVHNCWTPWFSVFGSMSGFDSLKEAFGEYEKKIYAIETGLSSDPAMNWRLSQLDRVQLLSNSDSHSPEKIGREANVFDLSRMAYGELYEAIRYKEKGKLKCTYEFYPEEGKYHYDGHRNCNVSMAPEETKKNNGICPVCKKKMTIGVMSRVEQIADRQEGFKPKGAVPFESLVPLKEVLGEAMGKKPAAKAVGEEYFKLIKHFGNEFAVLHAKHSELAKAGGERLAEAIRRVEEGRVKKVAGYDGEYGKIIIFGEKEKEREAGQKTLEEF